jgi:acyl-CoA reductase-like NAD-dependent aldehyde dehydrogenase
VGRLLLAQAAERVVKCSMELGGNAPFIVLDDADLGAAVDGALIAKLRHNAETCTAANRFYVARSVAAEFSDRLSAAMAALKVGNGLDPTVRIGPLLDAATRAKVTRLVEAAVAAGARVRTGGIVPPGAGYFYPPTVLDNVRADSPILAEEIFGPVAPIVAFDELADALQHANASEAGLVGYVYSRDRPCDARRRSPGMRDGRHQPRDRLRSGGALRRHQAKRDRPRRRPRRSSGVHGNQVHRRRLVTARSASRQSCPALRDRAPATRGPPNGNRENVRNCS